MKLFLKLISGIALGGIVSLGLTSCSSNEVVVVDARTGAAIPGATVYKKSGDLESGRKYTDGAGSTTDPDFPISGSQKVVAKKGYQTFTY